MLGQLCCGLTHVGHVLAPHVNDGAAATELELYSRTWPWPEPTGSNRLYRIGQLVDYACDKSATSIPVEWPGTILLSPNHLAKLKEAVAVAAVPN